ncbi:MAG: flagellar basal body rod C-terminal domain-containing protein [Armatimonadota bacterium]|nr:flagellar basal body protein [Armatimonadota bacterium]MDW8157226.1 flagellar basal body rod C-terminal domain-containing protein [Armatimonadota bacterium]
MLSVLRAAAAAMSAEQVRADLVAHNLANSETDGFHRLLVTVRPGEDQPLYRRDAAAEVGSVASGPSAPQAAVDPRPGALVPTEDRRDLAVEGRGFVLLEGNRLASSGRLGVDGEGFLTLRGVRVQGADGPVRVGGEAFRVRPDGAVEVAGRVVGRLRVVDAAPVGLSLVGPGLYAAPPQALREVRAPVREGFQQRGTVNAVEELVQLIAGLRAYEAAAKCVQVADETASRLADVARL